MNISELRELEAINSLLYDTIRVVKNIVAYDSSRLPLNEQFDKIKAAIERYWADY